MKAQTKHNIVKLLWMTTAFLFIAGILIPFGFLWSLNTLFNMGIPFNAHTWLATVVLLVITGSIMKSKFK